MRNINYSTPSSDSTSPNIPPHFQPQNPKSTSHRHTSPPHHRSPFSSMESETQNKKIESTVLKILSTADLETMTEHNVRKTASAKLGIDLNVPHHKAFVRRVVEAFLTEKQAEQEAAEAEQQGKEVEGEEEEGGRKMSKEYDDEGDLIICHLSDKRRVTVQNFRGKTLVSIREYYKKDGKTLPTAKGISLTIDHWLSFKKNVPAIEKAIAKLRG